MRHRGGAATPWCVRFGCFSGLGLHEQNNVACHLTENSGKHATGAQQGRQTITLCMPGRVRITHTQLFRHGPACGYAMIAEGRQSTAGAAELQHQAFFEGRLQPRAAAL
jgi:hypothetical protein